MNGTLLGMEKICYSYEDGGFALRDITLGICGEERIAVLGSNGAGKSTFFLLCNGGLRAGSGALTYSGETVDVGNKKQLHRLRQRVGIVFQDPNQQIIGSTVGKEISFGPMNLKLPKAEVAGRVDTAVEAMGLTAHRARPPHYLSGGEKKRVTIADVLAMAPEIILFDEPTAALDPAGVQALERTLAQLSRQKKALLVSTHDIDFAWRWARRLLVFCGGRLVADNTPEAVFSDSGLLEKARLRRPYLYEFARCMHTSCGWPADFWPKTTEEIEAYLGRQ